MFNDEFYPTPQSLRNKMYKKINGCPRRIIDPQGGKGDLLEGLDSLWVHHQCKKFAIEINPDLRAILRAKNIAVVDSDFLAFQGAEFFDLYLMNPPFSSGEKHLLKAIDQLFSGQIICLLNAENLRNPYTNSRQLLVRRLKELGAEIEYHQHAFLAADSERKTSVEVALINIEVKRQIEDDLFKGVADVQDVTVELHQDREISRGVNIEEMVAEYNQSVKIGTDVILNYFRHKDKIGSYLSLYSEQQQMVINGKGSSLTETVQIAVHELISGLRKDFWRRTLTLKEVQKRLTDKKMKEFEKKLTEHQEMDFTVSNIRSFALNVISSYENTITEAIVDLFDRFTMRHCYYRGEYEQNIWFFNGWKTNDAYRIRNKVIVPIHASYGNAFYGFSGLQLDYQAKRDIEDFDKVFNYFDGLSNYTSLTSAIEEAFKNGQTKNIVSTYFTVSVFRKGTMHIRFNNPAHVRKLNYVACKYKNFLPGNFGETEYHNMTAAEQTVVDSFEGRESYEKHFGQPVIADNQRFLLVA